MQKLEYGLCLLLAIAGMGHTVGSFLFYTPGTDTFVWALSASALVFTLVFMNVLRIHRPGDRTLAIGTATATLIWAGLALAFGHSIGAIADPRVLMQMIVSLGLVATTVAALSGSRATTR